MFDWGVLKCEVPESVRFCICGLPMNTFFIPTHPIIRCYMRSTGYIFLGYVYFSNTFHRGTIDSVNPFTLG